MHIVAIHHWRENDPAAVQTLAAALGILVFEARQRMAGGGPAVVASFAEPQHASALAARLAADGLPAFVLDAAAVRGAARVGVRRFTFAAEALCIETPNGEASEMAYGEISLLLTAMGSGGQVQSTTTVTERKLSLGKTLLAGGLPMRTKVSREETVTSETRDEILFLQAKNRPPALFARAALNYDGLGPALQPSRDRNFSYLKTELRRRAPAAVQDDRLLRRAGQVRLLGPTLDPGANLDLAFALLAQSLL